MVNDLGVDPDDWFDNPLDKMPIAKDYPSWEDTAPSEYEPQDPPAELMEVPTSVTNPKPQPKKEEKTMHQKMYEIATSRYNPFSVGGSENCDSDISCNIGGSEQIQ
tara:strand:+ start:201 stop:518 length:318 start_codon:yes stop_codon:yes gene_type:complete